jgi:hypothetical protein
MVTDWYLHTLQGPREDNRWPLKKASSTGLLFLLFSLAFKRLIYLVKAAYSPDYSLSKYSMNSYYLWTGKV